MPEGPTIVILKELLQKFKGKAIIKASGNAKVDMHTITGQTITDFKSWGKQFFIILNTNVIRIHFLMWGSYSIDEQSRADKSIRLHLVFDNGEIYFNTCSVKLYDKNFLADYAWEADVMSEEWDAKKALQKLKAQPEMMVCDALLDQNIFSGSGNIIKNEVLYRIKVHPQSLAGKLPAKKLKELVNETRNYSFDFLKWKKEFTLRKHWLAHTKKTCMQCGGPITKIYAGKTNRRTFFCEKCQQLYH